MLDRDEELEELNFSEISESGYYSDKLTVSVDSGESESEFSPQFSSTPHR